ncbi:FAD-dependent oxidoreductase [Ancylobacter oerskovii]|uniref:FAD-dependent oxidoreductase n=1 Tax=Ancylobacter oerskovii TaxID=459519 RepID=A0ABW4Z125_9HYPH|nr:FAD-dependent oxidoreductase [Ancylobacter oerskovii]MBS7542749.1 FAD-dependent oxidoreductase [Ancylobacter oerskovii]
MKLTLPAPDRHSIAGKTPEPDERAEIVVIGAGPAGCAAAIEAARVGAQVVLIDENPVSAGLIGMDVPLQFGGRATPAVQTPERLVEQVLEANPALGEAFEIGVDVRLSTSAWGAWVNGPGLRGLPCGLLGLADETRSWTLGFDRLILATGARDLNLSFAGSDQPGVMGAQALHALLTRYDAFAGRRLAILGTGALALDAAELALARGLDVEALVEARVEPVGEAARIAALAAQGVEIITGHVPLAAEGGADGVTGLLLANVAAPERHRSLDCDTVCLAIGAVPVIELFDVLGAKRALAPERGGHVPVLGADGATSLAEVFAAGDCTGLGGDAAQMGRVAARGALASLGRPVEVSAPVSPAAGPDALAYQLDWARALLATGGPDVLACLCEEVTRGELIAVQPPRYLGWSSNAIARRNLGTLAEDGPLDQDQIKRLTRACMGACQARRCREQVALMMALGAGVPAQSIPLAGYRAPVRPLPLSVLADGNETAGMAQDWNVWFGIVTQWISYDDIGTEREDEQLRAGMPY